VNVSSAISRRIRPPARRARPRPAQAWVTAPWLTLGAVFCGLVIAGSVGVAAAPQPPGRMVDIGGGRRLRLVCEGPVAARPVVLFESGAFGFSGDWAYVQTLLAAQGVRSCAYDRAGLGLSDRSPEPRDGINVARDLEKLVAAAPLPGPFVLVGHSMAGARVHLFANRNPDKVAGLALVDSTPPEALADPRVRRYVAKFATGAHAAAITSSFGILRLLAATRLGDKIGLPPEQDAEKRRQFASARYNHVAYEEALRWPLAAEQARRTGPLDPRWPVAVVTAGVEPGPEGAAMQAAQTPPARASQHGYVEVAQGATHNGLLGAHFAGSIVRGIDFVLDAARKTDGRQVATD
jgi:pimeloyl-ACP methyl ester carboxylesterase